MLFTTTQYIKFLLKSTNQHGVHSPFVYDLVTKCFYDCKKYNTYISILNYKKALLKNNTTLHVTDLGVGSKVMKQQERLVSELAKNAGTTYKRAKLLYRLTQYLKPNNILELGTSLGIASYSMSLGNPEAHISSIEGCPNISNFTKANLKTLGAHNIEVVNSNFSDAIVNLNKNQYDLIFFDGNHQKEATLHYFETLLNTVHNDSVFIFDDIHWSKGMTEAWDIIKQHHKVTVTIDTFFWGFVFFRNEQAKEHFTIRF